MHLGQLYEESARQWADKPYLVVDDDVLTFGQLQKEVEAYARAIVDLGVLPGDRVAFHVDNCPEIAALYFACFYTGAVAMPVSCFDTAAEAAFSISDCRAKILITEPALAYKLPEIKKQAPVLENCFILGKKPAGDFSLWEDRVRQAANTSAERADLPEDAPAVVLYTSGSTGRPKGVTHTHGSLCSGVRNRSASFRHNSQDRFLIASKLCHGAGLTSQLLPLAWCGGTTICLRGHGPEDIHLLMRRWQPNFVGLSPALLQEMLGHPSFDRQLYEPVSALYVGGDKAPGGLHALCEETTGVPLREAMGMTECGGFLNCHPYQPPKPGSVGRPIENTEVRIVDEQGEDVRPGEQGQLIVRTQAMMAGYWGAPEVTAQTIHDGWLRTGDIAWKDKEGYYFIAGRIKNVIIRDTGNITPSEVEEAILTHPEIRQCGVFGMPDGIRGEAVWAAVVAEDPVKPPDSESLAAHAKGLIAERKVPSEWMFMDRLPLTGIGKIDRQQLKKMAGSSISKTG